MRFKVTKIIVLILSIFVGVGAYVGGVAMLIKPDGSLLQMQAMLPYFQVLPFSDILFQDYVFSGIALIIVNGVSNTIAAILMLRNKRIGYVLGTVFGFTLMLWIIIQFVIFPINALDIIYFALGVLQLLFGYIALVSYNQYFFKFDESDYPDINENSTTLVVYFSRVKFTKKIAYITANNEHACIRELATKERTKGTLGFWWCGRFGMHAWPMETLPLDVDLSHYEKVILVTPIWVFRMCAPMRDFVQRNKDVLNGKPIKVVFNHFNPWLPKGAIAEVKSYVHVDEVESFTTMLGHTFKK